MQFEILVYEEGNVQYASKQLVSGFSLAVQTAATMMVQRFRKYVIAERSVKVETLYLSDTDWAATIQESIGDVELYGIIVQRPEANI